MDCSSGDLHVMHAAHHMTGYGRGRAKMALNRDRAGKAGAIPFSALLSDAPWQISRYHRPALGAQLTHQLHNLCILLHIRSALTRCWSLRTRQMSDDEHYQHFASRDWRRTSGDQGPLMSSGLSTFCHLCRHWTSVLSTKCSAAWQGTLSAPQPTEAPHRFILLPQKNRTLCLPFYAGPPILFIDCPCALGAQTELSLGCHVTTVHPD